MKTPVPQTVRQGTRGTVCLSVGRRSRRRRRCRRRRRRRCRRRCRRCCRPYFITPHTPWRLLIMEIYNSLGSLLLIMFPW